MQYFTLILGFLLSILSAQFLKLRTSNHILKTALHTSLSSVSSNTVNYTPPGTPSNATNMSAAFLSTIAARRSMYQLANRSPITDRQIRDIVTKSLDYVPSAFNSQTTRMVLLLHDDHRKLWQIVLETLKEMGTMKDTTKDRIQGMENAYGTILFYKDSKIIKKFQEDYSIYKDKFPNWADQTAAMHQLTIWTAFHAEGLGCNLQHYNPVIDDKVTKQWGLDDNWKLDAQLVFGEPTGPPGEKPDHDSLVPLDQRMRSFGSDFSS